MLGRAETLKVFPMTYGFNILSVKIAVTCLYLFQTRSTCQRSYLGGSHNQPENVKQEIRTEHVDNK